MWGATYPACVQTLKFLQNQGIRGIVCAHFWDSVNPYYSQFYILQTDGLFNFNVVVNRREPENQTQTDEVQNDDFVKTVH